jgi:pimeloyl-ACP methyl ester carboxylesterase
MSFTRRSAGPRLERLFRIPLGDNEVPAVSLDRAEELEAEEAGGVVDGMRTMCEALLQFGARALGNFDCIDLHNGHRSKITRGPVLASVEEMTLHNEGIHDEGGVGPPILLLHGLMGGARTWSRHVPWLREYGHVYTFDAAGHGRPAPAQLTTEAFVEDLSSAVESITEPMVVIGHSMGALHGWCFAATHPDRIRGIVVEDMAPDFRGGTATHWAAMIAEWPQPFPTADAVLEFFGPVAGQYFLDSFERRDDGFHLHGSVATFRDISEEWGTREFWSQWAAISAPALVIEAEYTITLPTQMRRMADEHPHATYVRIAEAGHLAHDDQPERYRAAVSAFLRTLT